MKTVLTIAGFDPSSGAGVTADLMVFAAHGLFGTSCITALTVQSSLGVRSTHPVSGAVVAETLDFLDADLRRSIVSAARRDIQDNYDTAVVAPAFAAALCSVIEGHRRARSGGARREVDAGVSPIKERAA